MDLSWLEELEEREDLVEVEAIMSEIKRQMALRGEEIIISKHAHGAPDIFIGNEAYWVERRSTFIDRLLKARVIETAEVSNTRGPYASGPSGILVTVEPEKIRRALEVTREKLVPRRRVQTGGALPSPGAEASREPPGASAGEAIGVPERLTAQWLWNHMPGSWWAWLAGAALTLLGLGVTLGQTTFVQEVLGIRSSEHSRAAGARLQSDVAALTSAHAARVDSLWRRYHALIEQANVNYMLEKGREAEALAKDVRSAIDAEDNAFARQLEAMRSINSGR